MKKILFMVSSMRIGGVEKSLLSLLSALPEKKYDVTLFLLEKKGKFLEYIPDWVNVEEALWFKDVKPIMMQPPQTTVKNFVQDKKYFKIPGFVGTYLVSKKTNNRYLYYKHVMRNVPDNSRVYDAAIAYQGPTDIIDFYIATKVKAARRFRGFILIFLNTESTRISIKRYISNSTKSLSSQTRQKKD